MILSGISQKSDQRVWAILCNRLEFESLNEFELKKGDIIKLGRMKLQLLEINYDNTDKLQQQIEEDDEQKSKDLDLDVSQCRICFCKSASLSNPLFSPCKCIGSMKYVHLNCLQIWIQYSIKIKNKHSSIQYIWKKMECEICKMPFKSTYKYQGQIFCIMQYQKPAVPYIVWKITSDVRSKEGIIQVMELVDKQEIKIGRDPDYDINLKDISVSRNHAIIKVITSENNKYKLLLQDNNSKFGTLLYVQSDRLLKYELQSPQKILYQIGKVLLYVQLKEKGKFYNKQFTCYRYPNQIQVPPKKSINEQTTIVPNLDKDKDNQLSFLIYNELNQDDMLNKYDHLLLLLQLYNQNICLLMIQQLNKWDCILEPILKNNVYIAGLYLADIDCALSLDLLQSLQIGALLSVIDEPKVDASAYIIHEVINIPDCTQQNIQDYFPQTNKFIEEHRQHTNVMVHCFAGISRSASVIIAYLMFKFQWGFQTALNYVVSKRPQVKPNYGFTQQLIQYERQNKIRQSSQQHQIQNSNPNKNEKNLSQSDSKSNRQYLHSKLDLNQLEIEIAQRQQELQILKLQYQQLNEKIISRNTKNMQSLQ